MAYFNSETSFQVIVEGKELGNHEIKWFDGNIIQV